MSEFTRGAIEGIRYLLELVVQAEKAGIPPAQIVGGLKISAEAKIKELKLEMESGNEH